VPPPGVAVAEPFGLPQVEETVVVVAVKTVGWVMVAEAVAVHPLASVIVMV
jgi:hypothetical protein